MGSRLGQSGMVSKRLTDSEMNKTVCLEISADEPVAGAQAWYTVAICLVLMVFSYTDRNIINLLAPSIQKHLSLSDVQVGVLTGPAFAVTYTALIFPLAWLGDRTTRRGVLFVCTLLWAIAACACGFARSYDQLVLARMAVGAGEAALSPAAIVLISSQFPQHRLAVALSVFSLGTIGGPALAMGAGAWIVSTGHAFAASSLSPWGWAFVLTGAPCLLIAPLVLTLRGATPHPAATATETSQTLLGNLRANPRIAAAIVFGFGALSVSNAALLTWMPSYLIRAQGWSMTKAGYTMGLMLIVFATVGKIGSGFVTDALFVHGWRDAHIRYPMIFAAISIPGIAILGLSPTAALALAGFGVYLLVIYPNMGYGSAFVQLVSPPRLRGRMSALYVLTANVFAALGPLAVGEVSDRWTGPGQLGLALTIVCVLALVAAIAIFANALAATRAIVATGHPRNGVKE